MSSKVYNAFLDGFIKAATVGVALAGTGVQVQAQPKVHIQANHATQPNKFSDPSAWVDTVHKDKPIQPRTIEAIKQKETPNVPGTTAVGDHGLALGPLQQHLDFYQSATNRNPALAYNAKLHQPYSYNDVTNLPYASAVLKSGLNSYRGNHLLDHMPWTTYNLARVYNGGPGGLTNPDTVPYANKVMQNLKQLVAHPGFHFPGAK